MNEFKQFHGYTITPCGSVFNKRTGEIKYTWFHKGRGSVYEKVQLWLNGGKKNFYIHRLVAMLYLPGWDEDHIVNHIDGDSLNNHVDNLEMCNQSYNIYESYWKREQFMRIGKIKTKVIMRVSTVNAINKPGKEV